MKILDALDHPRTGFAVVFLACAGLLGFAYYAQYVMYLDPCPMCYLQRFAFMVMALFALIGLIHGSRGAMRWVWTAGVGAGSVWGAVTAARHIWIQNLPPDQVPDCGGGFEYNMQMFGLGEALRSAFAGSGDCAQVSWSFLGLSMPWWTLIWYVGLLVFLIVAVARVQSHE
jgi:disulfide bond formation protein DsbB